jgi:hypothetical protein
MVASMSENGVIDPTRVHLPKIYAFDVDHTLWVSAGPVTIADVMSVKREGHILGLCGNYAAVTMRFVDWHSLFSFIGPGNMTKQEFLTQLKTYVLHSECVMVGNDHEDDKWAFEHSVSTISMDKIAAKDAGWRFISETAFHLGAR